MVPMPPTDYPNLHASKENKFNIAVEFERFDSFQRFLKVWKIINQF